ncbi:MAG: L-serine ammonia-lyase, iron-sulfur-dependent, subunit alpha, partial [Lachnospiraceae bacterium]|nr:L-serine ammonia-lyase, iron-sulfur-dependent, subunit alpha [Lachnospiraceae bacterium]
DIDLTGYYKGHSARVRITNNHTNIVYMKKDDEILLDQPVVGSAEDHMQDKSVLNVADIVAFADTADLNQLKAVLKKQAVCNYAVAKEGLRGGWGAQIGKTLLETGGKDIITEAKAYAAAGSDARMSGCEMPVVILSGSGNQGITATLPIICYAEHIHADEELFYRSLAVSDLVTIHQKTGIGRLSAYCGAVSAGVGAGAGIAYMMGDGVDGVSYTISNAAAILSGTICDGAKSSCAAKIASAVEAGIMGYRMYARHNNFQAGDGIVGKDVEEMISHIGILASQGMKETDRVILSIMSD